MTFKNIEDSIKTLSDVSEAPYLRARVKELEEELIKQDQAHARELKALQEENARIEASYSSLKSLYEELVQLRITYKNDIYNLRGIDRIARNRMDQNVKKSIKKQAQKLCEDQLPLLLEAEIKNYPLTCSNVTSRIINKRATQLRDEYLRDPTSWPQWFKAKVSEEAQKTADKMADELFWENVMSQVDQEIMQRLPNAWKHFLREYATSFMMNTFRTQLLSLMIPLELTCPKCGENVQFTPTPDDLSAMQRIGYVTYVCPYAKGLFKHQFRIYLGALFWIVMKGDVEPIRHSIPIRTVKYVPLEK